VGYTGDGVTCSGKNRFVITYDCLKLRPYRVFYSMTAGFRKQWLFFLKNNDTFPDEDKYEDNTNM